MKNTENHKMRMLPVEPEVFPTRPSAGLLLGSSSPRQVCSRAQKGGQENCSETEQLAEGSRSAPHVAGRVPGWARIDLFPAAPAAPKMLADFRDRNRLGQRVYVHDELMPAGLTDGAH